jgi:hypothetical protein
LEENLTPYNTRLAQWGLKWLIETLRFYCKLVLADNLVFQNPPLRQAWERCAPCRMKKLLITLIGLLTWTSGQTCDCDVYIGNFQTTSKWAEFVFVVKVKGYSYYKSVTTTSATTVSVPTAATFEIVETLKGKVDKKEIIVFGDKGNLCRPYIDVFKNDSYYIVGLYRCDGREQNETTDDFQISGCGEFWIKYDIESKTATGLIKNRRRKQTTVTLATLKDLIKKN